MGASRAADPHASVDWATDTPTAHVSPTTMPTVTDTPHPTLTPTLIPSATPTSSPSATPDLSIAQVLQVLDGDTIEVLIAGQAFTVRYIGIDAPETSGNQVERMAEEATAANEALVGGKAVRLERDVSDTDKSGRLLRHVFVGDMLVSGELVRQGFAAVIPFAPDLKYQALLSEQERAARAAGSGMWAAKPTATLGSSTSGGCPQGCTEPPPGCLIKGNINSSGERIYHVPGGQSYNQTHIDPSKGERWFCSEEEALANGWRKSKR